jgi:hypothetical protein
MRQTVAEATLILSSKSIDSMRAMPLAAPPLDPPLSGIADEVSLRARTEMLASLLERELQSGTRAADIVCEIWRGARSLDSGALRCLMSLLEVRLSGVELLRRALGASQLFRAYRRAALGAAEYSQDTWRDVLETGHSFAARVGVLPNSLHTPEARAQVLRRATALLESLLAGKIQEVELAWLTGFAEVEMRAMSERLAGLAQRVGACDGRRISQILPVLSKEEERLRDTRGILLRLPSPQDLVRRNPVLESRLQDRGFDGLVREIGARPEGLEAARAMVLTSWRAPLATELAFFAAVTRLVAVRLAGVDSEPLDPARALLLALMTRRQQGLGLELNSMELRTTAGLWESLEVQPRAGRFLLPWNQRKYEPMLPEDGIPELTYPAVHRSTDLRDLVKANIQNESVISGLLGVPRVANLAGLIEWVVVRSRSIKILLEIANRRELYTGAANRNVPKALLWHPTPIPVSAIRKFVHVRFVDRAELVALCARGSRARSEVRQMAAMYLDSLTKT